MPLLPVSIILSFENLSCLLTDVIQDASDGTQHRGKVTADCWLHHLVRKHFNSLSFAGVMLPLGFGLRSFRFSFLCHLKFSSLRSKTPLRSLPMLRAISGGAWLLPFAF